MAKPAKRPAKSGPKNAPPPRKAAPKTAAPPAKKARHFDVFISYRRSSAKVVKAIHDGLTSRMSETKVFIDSEAIEPGARFPDSIAAEVQNAAITLVVIGKTWVSAQDERTFRRRLDAPNDWVRREVEVALGARGIVIPVLIEGAAPPTPEQLPDSIDALAEQQAFALSPKTFDADLAKLTEFVARKLREARRQAIAETRKYPDGESPAALVKPKPLTAKDLAVLRKALPEWKIVEAPLTDDTRYGRAHKRVELMREFKFESFRHAIDFMRGAAANIDGIDHHPRWENVYSTVTVWLSTWDIGHRPSDRDQKVAVMLERHYQDYLDSKV